MKILAIESSCDETGIAIIEVKGNKFKVLSNVLNSQIKIHQRTHGVVPEVAARRHVEVINPMLDKVLKEAKVKLKDIDLIGVTYGPGLIGSLIVGIEVAKAISQIAKKPLIGINHLRAHLMANYFNIDSGKVQELKYPAVALLVSGGHTELVLIKSAKNFKVIGDTLDDAVGETFDKVARLLGLPYPGGPSIAKEALLGNRRMFNLPIPLKNSHDFNFSYSGLKTAVRDLVSKQTTNSYLLSTIPDICASFEYVAIEHLVLKTLKAIDKHKAKTLLVAGGVSANKYLREQLATRIPKSVELHIPPFHLCTDNALMIAMATYMEYKNNPSILKKNKEAWKKLKPEPTLDI